MSNTCAIQIKCEAGTLGLNILEGYSMCDECREHVIKHAQVFASDGRPAIWYLVQERREELEGEEIDEAIRVLRIDEDPDDPNAGLRLKIADDLEEGD